jgi:hypothetical protein
MSHSLLEIVVSLKNNKKNLKFKFTVVRYRMISLYKRISPKLSVEIIVLSVEILLSVDSKKK